MTRSQLITKVSVQTNLSPNQVEGVLDNIVDTIVETLAKKEKVTIAGFGRFEMRQRKTKAFTNPKTKVSSQLEPTNIPGFKASGLMKENIQAAIDKK